MTTRRQTGFTLVEILIVAALMSLLAGIAAINIQRAYVDNQRKATYGEAYNIKTALCFAFEDIGLYPKLCFLQRPILYLAPPTYAPFTQPGGQLVSGFEYMGYEVNQSPTLVQRVVNNWAKGMGSPGYFSAGSGRRGLFQGRRGGMCLMEIPVDIYSNPVLAMGENRPVYEWPSDPWGRPYVVYMLRLAGMKSNGLPDVRFVNSYSETANYALAVVSYGPNGIPGGRDDYDAATLNQGFQLRLYDRSTIPGVDFRALRPQEYTAARCEAWSFTKLLGTPGPLAYPGVIDEGSDDIVVEF
ncbi:MAG: type II secretion system GspH family protein [Candidatus Sumerlaeia bacterium]|nr:type II secretion system GspH family protein [Candidatus Sumerlaeia bacterium]